MILLWGLSGDGPLDAVRAELDVRHASVAFIDQRRVLETEVDLSVGAVIAGTVRCGARTIPLAEATAVFLRLYDATQLPVVAAASPLDRHHVASVEDALASFCDLSPALVVTRPSLTGDNGCKPHQLVRIRAAGFAVPETLVTTDPDAARAFWASHKAVIYKSISGTRSVVSRLTAAHEDRLADLQNCPTQLQAWVPGTDYRVHVVGTECFACRIVSKADDYRYAAQHGRQATITAARLPAPIRDRCIELAQSMALPLAGIDLRLTPNGEWFCFEVNPAPGFTFFAERARQPIAQAVAALLAPTPPSRAKPAKKKAFRTSKRPRSRAR